MLQLLRTVACDFSCKAIFELDFGAGGPVHRKVCTGRQLFLSEAPSALH